MKTQTKTVKGRYEAPECQALIFAFDSMVLSASQEIKNNSISMDSFSIDDDSSYWN